MLEQQPRTIILHFIASSAFVGDRFLLSLRAHDSSPTNEETQGHNGPGSVISDLTTHSTIILIHLLKGVDIPLSYSISCSTQHRTWRSRSQDCRGPRWLLFLISLAALMMVEQCHFGKVISSFPRSVCVVRGRRPDGYVKTALALLAEPDFLALDTSVDATFNVIGPGIDAFHGTKRIFS